MKLLMKTARSVSFELADGGKYYTTKPYRIFLNGAERKTADTVVTSLFDLKPETEYLAEVYDGNVKTDSLTFTTDREFVTLNVRDFGAAGDGSPCRASCPIRISR